MSRPSRCEVNEVFQPRARDVNPKIYVSRPDHEKALRRALAGSQHAVICGDSGTGKTWLYRKVLREGGTHVTVANCANALRSPTASLTDEISRAAVPTGTPCRQGYSERKAAEIGGGFGKGILEHTNQFAVTSEDPLLAAFRSIRNAARQKDAVLVLDNLEQVFDREDLIRELASIVILLDDPTYAEQKIKILIVGTQSQIIEYFARIPSLDTVANRLHELPAVSALTEDQCSLLVRIGFCKLLGVDVPTHTLQQWQRHIYAVTLGIAQAAHEYCEQLGYILEDRGWYPSLDMLHEADSKWLRSGLTASYHVVGTLMNERRTRVGRRNQVLYSLGQIDTRAFSINDVENIVRREFPQSTSSAVHLGVAQILTDLASRENTLLRRCQKGNKYEVTRPRHLMCLRCMLRKRFDETVIKLDIP